MLALAAFSYWHKTCAELASEVDLVRPPSVLFGGKCFLFVEDPF